MMTQDYRKKFEMGLEYQDFISDLLYTNGLGVLSFSSKKYQLLKGENKAGIEIKFDDRYKKTGNLYIETAEKTNPSNPNYIKSGIFRNDNAWLYIIGNYQKIFIFAKKTLIRIKDKFVPVVMPTSRGFLLPNKDAEYYCAKAIILKNNETQS